MIFCIRIVNTIWNIILYSNSIIGYELFQYILGFYTITKPYTYIQNNSFNARHSVLLHNFVFTKPHFLKKLYF